MAGEHNNQAGVWPKIRFAPLLIALLLLLNAYPLYQIFAYNGLVFYSNGLDEGSYLQYHYALRELSLAVRPGQYLVVWLHQAGLSGGWINLLMDLVCLSGWLIVVRAIFRQLGADAYHANSYAFLLTALPLLFGGFNPVVSWLSDLNTSSHWIYWVTMPQAKSLPILRSPEPQSSMLLMGIALYLSLRFRSFLPAYLATPLLYSFMAVPWVFVVGALHFSKMIEARRFAPVLAPVLAYVLLGLALAIYFEHAVTGDIRNYIIESRLPLISFTGCLSVPLFWLVRKRLEQRMRAVLAIVAIAPWAGANQQILSGWIAQPNNFEQYFGVLAVSFLTIYALEYFWKNLGLFINGLALLTVFCGVDLFAKNHWLNSRITLTPQHLESLRLSSELVAINHIHLSYQLNLLFPMQQPTLFSFSRTQHGLAPQNLGDYICAKQEVSQGPEMAPEFEILFKQLDWAYQNQTQTDPNITLFRSLKGVSKLDLGASHKKCRALRLHYIRAN